MFMKEKILAGIVCAMVHISVFASEFVTINSPGPGQLELSADAMLAYKLKVTGHIDARDLNLLKVVTMNTTRELDLSEAVIEAYEGTEGTALNMLPSWIIKSVGHTDVDVLNPLNADAQERVFSPKSTPHPVKYEANVLPTSVFAVTADMGLTGKVVRGSFSLCRLVLPATLEDIDASALDGVSMLTKLEVPANATALKSIDGVVYTRDMKRLVAVAPMRGGMVDVPSSVEKIDSCAFLGVKVAGLKFNSPTPPDIEAASLINAAYVQASNADAYKSYFPEIDCVESIEEIFIEDNEAGNLLENLGNLGYKREDVRSVRVTGAVNGNDVAQLLELPNVYYVDLSGATLNGQLAIPAESKLCEIKLPSGSYDLSLSSPYLHGDLVVPEGVTGFGCSYSRFASVAFPSTMAAFAINSFNSAVIESADFSKCTNLKMIDGFKSCSNLRRLQLPSSLEVLSNVSGGIESLELPEGLVEISDCSLWDVESLRLPTSLTTLDNVYRMLSLKEVEASQCTKLTIANDVFWGCPLLKKIDFSNSPLESFSGLDADNIIWEDGTVRQNVISNGISGSGSYDYYVLDICGIEEVKLPNSLKRINAFDCATNLKKIELEHCYRLEQISGMRYCYRLASVSLPPSLITVNNGFIGCTGLAEISVAALTPPSFSDGIDSEAIAEAMANVTLKVPSGRRGTYLMSEGWDKCKQVVEGGYSVSITSKIDNNFMISGAGMYDSGTQVQLSFKPEAINQLQDYELESWSIGDSGKLTGDEATFVVTGNTAVTANVVEGKIDVSRGNVSFDVVAEADTKLTLKVTFAERTFDVYSEQRRVYDETFIDWNGNTIVLNVKAGRQSYAIVGDVRTMGFGENDGSEVIVENVSCGNASSLIRVNVSNAQVRNLDLSGCGTLKSLYASNCGLETLNVDGCVGLTNISVDDNELASLDLTDCNKLESLRAVNSGLENLRLPEDKTSLTTILIADNAFKELSLQGCHNVNTLSIAGNAGLEVLDLSGCSSLTDFRYTSGVLRRINLSGCTGLGSIYITDNALEEIDLTDCANLEQVDLSNNCLVSFTAPANPSLLTNVNLSNNAFSELSLSGCASLSNVELTGNSIARLDLSGCKSFPTLYLNDMGLETLDVSGCSGLMVLIAQNNSLRELNLQGCESLFRLYVTDNLLEELDLSDNPEMSDLYIRGNPLKKLNLSGCAKLTSVTNMVNNLDELEIVNLNGCTGLTEVKIDNNAIRELDFTNCTNLTKLEASASALESVDLTGCAGLQYMDVRYNNLTELDLRSCTNLSDLRCYNNLINVLQLAPNTPKDYIMMDGNPIAFSAMSQYLYNLMDGNGKTLEYKVVEDDALQNGYLDLSAERYAQDSSTPTIVNFDEGDVEDAGGGRYKLLSEGQYSFTLTNADYPGMKFCGSFVYDGTSGVDNELVAGMNVFVGDGYVTVNGLSDGTVVMLYGIDGKQLGRTEAANGEARLDVPNGGGVYLLDIDTDDGRSVVKFIAR